MSSQPLSGVVRSVQSFGVSGLLSPEAKVFHQVFYDAGGLGRAADLVAARLRESKPDEYSLHALVLFGVLGASRVFETLSPIQFECGMDSAHFAFSFGFELQDSAAMSWDGIAERVATGVAVSPLDELLLAFCRNADHVVLRGHPGTRKVEICALARWGRRSSGAVAPLEVVIFSKEPEAAPEASEYTALADLDYSELLRSRRTGAEPDAPVTGEVLMHEASSAEELVTRIRAKRLALEDSTLIRVSGPALAESDDTEIVIPATSESESDSDSEGQTQDGRKGIFSRIMRWNEPESPGAVSESEVREVREVDTGQEGAAPEGAPAAMAPMGTGELQIAARELERTLNDGALTRASREVASIQAEIQNPRIERWVENLMTELNAERARIVDASKKMANSVRLKELEFKNRENSLQQHLRDRDDVIRSKTSQLMRMKDQLAKMQIQLERAKLGAGSGDETAMKYKYNQSQKLLQGARAEAESLRVRVEELQGKLYQLNEHKKQAVPIAVHNELQRQVERQARQIEELRRQKSAPAADELRRNLEIAQRVAMHQKQRSEQLELVLQERKVEIERLTQELEKLRPGRPGSQAA